MAIRMGVKRSEISSGWGRALNQIGSHFYRDTCFPEDRICAESHAREKDFKKRAVPSSLGSWMMLQFRTTGLLLG